jgi:heme-degrading monooxygenase HmoA
MFANTPEPPYLAVIFSSLRTIADEPGYERMSARMVELAATQPGYLGIESSRDAAGFGISVSYWASEEAVLRWKAHVEHLAAQELGRSLWYAVYRLRVARVERAYGFEGDLE